MKNKKLRLQDLKVKSFVTEMKSETKETVKAGIASVRSYVIESLMIGCPTNPGDCQPTDTYITGCTVCPTADGCGSKSPSDTLCPIPEAN